MAPAPLQLLAPAKLNLFLHITGRRADGYHELQTLFQLLDYGDTMEFTLAEPGVLALHSESTAGHIAMPLDDNLILQAATQLKALDPRDQGASISIRKRIPLGAGLEGGSSNAAMALLALNSIWRLNLSLQQLCEIGVKLGADVPVFIQGHSAWAEGIGERLQPTELADSWYLVITPECAVSSAKIFCHEQLTRNSPAITIADFLVGGARNDCESVTRMLYPEVDAALNWLAQFTDARMTGTGSSIFANFPDKEAADKILEKLPAQFGGFVAKAINSLEHKIPGA
jgi:4-diphosphocytidyl-2-C-methyl-D-erythritol kinase